MKIEYDVPVDKVQSKPTGEHTQSLKDFIASDRDNMLLDFENDIQEATTESVNGKNRQFRHKSFCCDMERI